MYKYYKAFRLGLEHSGFYWHTLYYAFEDDSDETIYWCHNGTGFRWAHDKLVYRSREGLFEDLRRNGYTLTEASRLEILVVPGLPNEVLTKRQIKTLE